VRTNYGPVYPFVFQDGVAKADVKDRIAKFRSVPGRRLANPIGRANKEPVFTESARRAEPVSARPGNDALLPRATEKPCAPIESAAAGGPRRAGLAVLQAMTCRSGSENARWVRPGAV
jgi:hypothetical protein